MDSGQQEWLAQRLQENIWISQPIETEGEGVVQFITQSMSGQYWTIPVELLKITRTFCSEVQNVYCLMRICKLDQ